MQKSPPPDDRREHGRLGEALAALFLEMEGYAILARNHRSAAVEVDLVARRGALLAVVEVKLRRSGLAPAPDALREGQWRRLQRAAQALAARHAWAETIRIDVVGLDWRDGELRLQHLQGVAPR